MAVLIEATSIVIKVESIKTRYSGGLDQFYKVIPNRTMCADNEILRIGFMSVDDVKDFIDHLVNNGLSFIKDDEADDLVVIDQNSGPTTSCRWIEYGSITINGHRVHAARIKDSKHKVLMTPDGWTYEQSLSNTYEFSPLDAKGKGMKFIRHEDGLDVYISNLTGEEVYVGRTGKIILGHKQRGKL